MTQSAEHSPNNEHRARVYMGIDPASGGFAYTIIKGRVSGDEPVATYIDSGKLDVISAEHIRETLAMLKRVHKITRVGVEVPGQFSGSGFESSWLISSAISIGMIVQVLCDLGLNVKMYPAQVTKTKTQYGQGWRYYLFDRKRRNRVQWDKLVKEWLTDGNIRKYPTRSNKDVRDSSVIAYALYVAERDNEVYDLGCVLPYDYHDYLKKSRSNKNVA